MNNEENLLELKEEINNYELRKDEVTENLDLLKEKFKDVLKEEKKVKKNNELLVNNNIARNLSFAMIFLFIFLTYSFFGFFSLAGLSAFIILYTTSSISLMKLIKESGNGFFITRSKIKRMINESNNEVKFIEEKCRKMAHEVEKNEVYLQELYDIIDNKKVIFNDLVFKDSNYNDVNLIKDNDKKYIKKR